MAPTTAVPAPDSLINKVTDSVSSAAQVQWGRRARASTADSLMAIFISISAPIWMYINWIALEHFDSSLSLTFRNLCEVGPLVFAAAYFPRPTSAAIGGYAAFVSLQAVLYTFAPGHQCTGQRTPGGHLLKYTANGMFAWLVTHALALAAVLGNQTNMSSAIADHWEGLIAAADIYGIMTAGLALVKGRFVASPQGDQKLSGSLPFDFFSGVELNPRLGSWFDLKFFHNGRTGIMAWTLINISWAAYQYNTHGSVSNAMIIVNVLQAIYVIDFFVNEDWYLRTVDIAHDHFGMYLAWGTSSFLPQLYTIEAQYLARYPNHLNNLQTALILGLGLAGYALFRSANWQKDTVRRTDGNTTIWNKSARVVRTSYQTSDGKQHQGLLLACGWWGICRHTNYLADLIQTFAMCAACGFQHVLPWSHFIWMCVLLLHRLRRDERRCRNKYGKQWDEYCETVPYRLIPGVWLLKLPCAHRASDLMTYGQG